MIERIISGGQTGADRGGLDAAIGFGIPHGGWCPKGRRAEDGTIPERYQLMETAAVNYQARTRRNAREADGTLLVTSGPPASGSRLTVETAERAGKPCLHLQCADLDNPATITRFREWLRTSSIRVLNVAGARESQAPGIQVAVTAFLVRALAPGQEDLRNALHLP